ncbi:hypothetical protein PM082_008396 [Marasmius tenuissimus]|nr:hypothetical protein PM082_008396 [Marasmius tenuissimus]
MSDVCSDLGCLSSSFSQPVYRLKLSHGIGRRRSNSELADSHISTVRTIQRTRLPGMLRTEFLYDLQSSPLLHGSLAGHTLCQRQGRVSCLLRSTVRHGYMVPQY